MVRLPGLGTIGKTFCVPLALAHLARAGLRYERKHHGIGMPSPPTRSGRELLWDRSPGCRTNTWLAGPVPSAAGRFLFLRLLAILRQRRLTTNFASAKFQQHDCAVHRQNTVSLDSDSFTARARSLVMRGFNPKGAVLNHHRNRCTGLPCARDTNARAWELVAGLTHGV